VDSILLVIHRHTTDPPATFWSSSLHERISSSCFVHIRLLYCSFTPFSPAGSRVVWQGKESLRRSARVARAQSSFRVDASHDTTLAVTDLHRLIRPHRLRTYTLGAISGYARVRAGLFWG
jgi:hypothetical protein